MKGTYNNQQLYSQNTFQILLAVVESHMKIFDQKNQPWWQALAFVLVIVTLLLKLITIDTKYYWVDEAYTSLRISGYTRGEFIKETSTGQAIEVDQLQKYQRVNPNKNVLDTVQSLGSEEPQLVPLYFVAVHLWNQVFGSTTWATRSFSVLAHCAVLACTYWLCIELSGSALTGWIAVCIVAVSPFVFLYSQEARPYALWMAATLFTSAVYLRATRHNTYQSWFFYAIAVAVSLYIYLFSALVILAHGLYTLIRTDQRIGKFVMATVAGSLPIVPWLIMIKTHKAQVDYWTSWTRSELPFVYLMKTWVHNLGLVFLYTFRL